MPVVTRGPLAGDVMERLAAWLLAERYARTVVPQVLGVARGLSAWMEDRGLPLRALGPEALEWFAAGYGLGVPGHAIVRVRAPALRRFLVEAGYLSGVTVTRKRTRRPRGQGAPLIGGAAARELDEWGRWQREARGLSDGCISNRRIWVAGLVDSLPVDSDGMVDWSACDVPVVNSFIGQRCDGFSPASRTAIVDATRSLVRWALASGRLERDLTGGILCARASRVTLPRGLSPVQVEELLAACDPGTVVGVRDRAVITMLWRLGLRAGEVAGLVLDDIDWAAGRVSVVGKGTRRLTLPIPIDVGQALVAWLRVRPEALDRAVFVRVRRPIRALTSAGISDIVKHRAEAAGLEGVHAHRLRHTAAMNVIAAGGNLIEAQELLGHHSSASTSVYARVDLVSLRTLTVPFGQVPS